MDNIKQNAKNGFTLVELIVVIVIIGVLAAIAIPALTGYLGNSKEKAVISECKVVVTATEKVAHERHALRNPVDPKDSTFLADIDRLAEYPTEGKIVGMVFDKNDKLTELLYSNGNTFVLYKNGEYTLTDEKSSSTILSNNDSDDASAVNKTPTTIFPITDIKNSNLTGNEKTLAIKENAIQLAALCEAAMERTLIDLGGSDATYYSRNNKPMIHSVNPKIEPKEVSGLVIYNSAGEEIASNQTMQFDKFFIELLDMNGINTGYITISFNTLKTFGTTNVYSATPTKIIFKGDMTTGSTQNSDQYEYSLITGKLLHQESGTES